MLPQFLETVSPRQKITASPATPGHARAQPQEPAAQNVPESGVRDIGRDQPRPKGALANYQAATRSEPTTQTHPATQAQPGTQAPAAHGSPAQARPPNAAPGPGARGGPQPGPPQQRPTQAPTTAPTKAPTAATHKNPLIAHYFFRAQWGSCLDQF